MPTSSPSLDALRALSADESRWHALFEQEMLNTVERWMEMADERLGGSGIRVFVCPGNDDQLEVDGVVANAKTVELGEGRVIDINGFQLAYAPDWTGLVGYTHNMPVGDATLRAHLDWYFESSWFGDYVHNLGTKQEASNKGDAYLTYDAGKWSVGLWIKNIQNRERIAATAAAGVPGPATSYMDPPRTYGLRFQVNY